MQLVRSESRNIHGIKLLPLVAFKGLRFRMCPGTPFHAGTESIILRSETSVCSFWMGSWVRDFPGSVTLCCSVIGSRGLDICKRAGIETSCDAGNGPRASDNSNEGNSLPSTARPCFSLLNSDYRSWLFHLPYFSGFSCPLYSCLRVCLCMCGIWSFSHALYGLRRLSDTFFQLYISVSHVMLAQNTERYANGKHRKWTERSGMWCWHTHSWLTPPPLLLLLRCLSPVTD